MILWLELQLRNRKPRQVGCVQNRILKRRRYKDREPQRSKSAPPPRPPELIRICVGILLKLKANIWRDQKKLYAIDRARNSACCQTKKKQKKKKTKQNKNPYNSLDIGRKAMLQSWGIFCSFSKHSKKTHMHILTWAFTHIHKHFYMEQLICIVS